jgi:RNA polymerase sigma-70 factor (ECF subfamily)
VHGQSDAEIIARSRREPAVFSHVFDRHFDAVHAYLARRLGRETADELASETFARAFDARGRFRAERSSALPWLMGIATNLIHRHVRTEVTRLHALGQQAARATEEVEQWHDERAAVALARPHVARALAALRPEDRDVLLLVGLTDLRYGDVAVALSIPVGTVRSRLSRARGQMREMLRDVPAIVGLDVTWPSQEEGESR